MQKTVRKPQFIERPKHTDVKEGHEAVFTLRLSGEPEVTWYHDEKPLKDDMRIGTESEGDDVFRLRIKDTKPDDAGRYKCLARNSAGDCSCVVSLRVKESFTAPEFSPVSETRYEVNEGDDVMFSAKVKGRPEPKIAWFKDEVRLRGDTRLKASKNGNEHTVTVTRATPLDSGIYKCTGSSPAGSSSVEFELVVKGKCYTIVIGNL